MNLSGIGSLLGAATSLIGGSDGSVCGAGSLAGSLFGGGSAQESGASADPLAAIANLTHDVDALATSGLGTLTGALTGGALGGGSGAGLLSAVLGGGGGAGLFGAAFFSAGSSGLLGSIAGMLA